MTEEDKTKGRAILILGASILVGVTLYNVAGWKWHWCVAASLLFAGTMDHLLPGAQFRAEATNQERRRTMTSAHQAPCKAQILSVAQIREFRQALAEYERAVAGLNNAESGKTESKLREYSTAWYGSNVYAEHEMVKAQERAVDRLWTKGAIEPAIEVCSEVRNRLQALIQSIERLPLTEDRYYNDESERRRDVAAYTMDLAHMSAYLAYLHGLRRLQAIESHVLDKHGISFSEITKGSKDPLAAPAEILRDIVERFPMNEEMRLYGEAIELFEHMDDPSVINEVHARGMAGAYERVATFLSSHNNEEARSRARELYEVAHRLYSLANMPADALRIRREVEHFSRAK